jgi:D-alanyl-D-alanine carboxypeptidase
MKPSYPLIDRRSLGIGNGRRQKIPCATYIFPPKSYRMRAVRAAALSLVLVTVTPSAASPSPDTTAIAEASTAVINSALVVQSIPGLEIGVLRDGQVVFDQGYGVQNIATRNPVDSNTIFEIGSITKQFTAAAILQLKAGGKLKLSDRLGKYVREYPLGKNVTVEQLLHMTSGIPDHINDPPNAVTLISTSQGNLNAALGLIKNMPLHFKPGTHQEYSNTNYLLLGAVVARVSHIPYSEYISKHIFAPAHMTHSAFLKDEDSLANMATGYALTPKAILKEAGQIGYGWSGGAGSIISTAGDMARWDEAFFSGRIISPADVKLATTPAVVNGRLTDYGFGWSIDTVDRLKVISHDGGMLGFTSINDVFPTLGLSIIVLANNGNASPDAIAKAVIAQLNPEFASKRNAASPGENPVITGQIIKVWEQLHEGQIDRSLLTGSYNKEITSKVLVFMHGHFAQLLAEGRPRRWIYKGKRPQDDGTTLYAYRVLFKGDAALSVSAAITKNGKIASCDTVYD